MDHHTVETCTVVRWISISGIFWEEWTPCAPDQRRKGSSRLLPATSPKARVCHGMGCVSALGKGNLHFCDGTINAEKYIEILEHNMLPSRRHLFQGRPCTISTRQCKTTFCTHYKVLAAEEEGTGTWLACLQSRPVSNRECVAHFEAQNATTKTPVLLPTLRLVCRKNGIKITPETLHHLVSSVPKRLLSVVKRNGNITKW